jgi:hypothetical protein
VAQWGGFVQAVQLVRSRPIEMAALGSYFAERLALTRLVYNVTHRQLVIAAGDH